jgi:hypothetical protein
MTAGNPGFTIPSRFGNLIVPRDRQPSVIVFTTLELGRKYDRPNAISAESVTIREWNPPEPGSGRVAEQAWPDRTRAPAGRPPAPAGAQPASPAPSPGADRAPIAFS